MLTLREARLRRRMSQQSLADSAGVARVTVSQIELGKSGPRPHIARRLADALGFQPSEIVESAPLPKACVCPRHRSLLNSRAKDNLFPERCSLAA
jgi:transcriptional regulator with XRE-family HTH domain